MKRTLITLLAGGMLLGLAAAGPALAKTRLPHARLAREVGS